MNLLSLVLTLLLVVMLDTSMLELIKDFLGGVGSTKLGRLILEVLGCAPVLAGLEASSCGGCFNLESMDAVGDPMDHLTPFPLVSDTGEAANYD